MDNSLGSHRCTIGRHIMCIKIVYACIKKRVTCIKRRVACIAISIAQYHNAAESSRLRAGRLLNAALIDLRQVARLSAKSRVNSAVLVTTTAVTWGVAFLLKAFASHPG